MRLTSAIGQPSIIDRRIYDMDLIVGKVKKKKKNLYASKNGMLGFYYRFR